MSVPFKNSGGKICVVAQPTFLPWVGWFDLVDQADVMVILDDVAFSKQSWQQRNRIRTKNGLDFLTVPIKTSGRLGQRIDKCEFTDFRFIEKILRSLQTNYARSPHFYATFNEISILMQRAVISSRLVELNCILISWLADLLGVTTPMVRASNLGVGGQRGEHIAAICESVGAEKYISPAGAENYLIEDREAFDRRDISVWLHVYEHPVYTQQFCPFIPYASAIDLVFNERPTASDIMRTGRRPTRLLGSKNQHEEKLI